jgi:hypothetical protein
VFIHVPVLGTADLACIAEEKAPTPSITTSTASMPNRTFSMTV